MPFPSTPLAGPYSTPLALPTLASLSLGLPAAPFPSPALTNPAVQSLRSSTSRRPGSPVRSPLSSPRFLVWSPGLGPGPGPGPAGDENVDCYFALGAASNAGTKTQTCSGTTAPVNTPCDVQLNEGSVEFAKNLSHLCGQATVRAPLSPSVLGHRQRGSLVTCAGPAAVAAKPKSQRPSFRLVDLPVAILFDPAPSVLASSIREPISVCMGACPSLSASASASSLTSHASEDTLRPALRTRLLHAGATPGVTTEQTQFFAWSDEDGFPPEPAHWANATPTPIGVEVDVTTLGSYSPSLAACEWRKPRTGRAKAVSWCDEEGRGFH